MNYHLIKYLISAAYVVILCSCGQRQHEGSQEKINDVSELADQELVIIGTIHFPSQLINADTLVSVLRNIEPDCILMEADSTKFDDDFNLIETYDENEYNAVIKYSQEAPGVQLRPIEFEGRDEYRIKKGLFTQPGNTFEILIELSENNELSEFEEEIWNKWTGYYSQLVSLGKKDLKALNTAEADAINDSLLWYQYVRVKEIVDSRSDFNRYMLDAKGDSVPLKKNFQDWAQFEYRDRNNAMTDNIVNTISSLPEKKKFVLFVGFQHRSYIKKELEKRGVDFKIKEFYN